MKRQVTSSLAGRPRRLRPTGAAMKRFPDGHQVRLRSVGRNGMYLVADEDGVGVFLSPLRESLHASWQVHRVVRGSHQTYILLHGAAYGRYLKATNDPAPSGHLGHNVVQGVYDDEDDNAVYWVPVEPADGEDEVRLHHINDNRAIRANGKYCRWRTGVSTDDYNEDTMMHWVVEDVSPSPGLPTPALPHPATASPQGAYWTMFFCRTAAVEEERRIVRFVQATDDWSFDPNGWKEIVFRGRSVLDLKSAVTRELAQGNAIGIELRMQAGRLGRLTPLHINLPRDDKPMDVVALCTFAPSVEFHEPLGQDEVEMKSQEEVPREPDAKTAVEFHEATSSSTPPSESTNTDMHGSKLASPSGSGRLDPEVVRFYCIKGSAMELLRYLDSIPGANKDHECNNINKYAMKLRQVGPVIEGEPISVKLKKNKRRQDLAHKASSAARNSRLFRPIKSSGPDGCNATAKAKTQEERLSNLGEHPDVPREEVEASFLVKTGIRHSIQKGIGTAQANLQMSQQEMRSTENLSEEQKQAMIRDMKKEKAKITRLTKRSVLDEQSTAKVLDNLERANIREG